PFRLHAHRGRAVTHLMDDPIVPDDAATAAARESGLPYFRGGIVEHGGAGQPIMEASHLPSGELHSRSILDSPMRAGMDALPRPGEALPQPTNRVALDPHVRDVWGQPAGRVTYSPHVHEMSCATHWAPRLEAVMRDAGAHTTFWVTSPPMPEARNAGGDPTP